MFNAISFTSFDVIILIGIVQGLLISGLLIGTTKNKRSNRLLAVMILILTILGFKMLQHTLGIWQTQYGRYLPLPFDLTTAPLFYLYFQSLLVPADQPLKNWKWHLLPTAILLIHALLVWFSTISIVDLTEKDALANGVFYFNKVKMVEDILMIFLSLGYLFFAYRSFIRFKKGMLDSASQHLLRSVRYMEVLFALFLLFISWLAITLILNYGFHYGETHIWHYQILYALLTLGIYILGLIGLWQPQLTEEEVEAQRELSRSSPLPSPEKIQEYFPRLQQIVEEEKLFLNPTLKLSEVAQRIGLKTVEVSSIIRASTQQNFKEFINAYRVETVKVKLQDPDFAHLSILGIALECGFNSEASFYRIFKKATGQSPKQFRSE